MVALTALFVHPTFETYPSISEHIFDVAVLLSDHIFDDVRNHVGRLDSIRLTDDPRCLFVFGAAPSVDGWLVLTKPVNHPINQSTSQPPTPGISQTPLLSPTGSQMPVAGSVTPQQQQRGFNPQQQRLQSMQAQQAQQMRAQFQYPQHSVNQNKMLPAQLQRTPSNQASPTALQQMQQMQQMQGLAQQRATQPSPVYTQRPTLVASSGAVSGGPAPLKLVKQEKEMKQYPFVQPRWEILAESSGNPNANETAISLTLFGARKV